TVDGTNLSATCQVAVNIPTEIKATSISLDKTTLSLSSVGQTSQLTATVLPTNATNKSVTWTSSNTSVATVDANGLVTAKANGTATITATTTDGSNKSATCSVTVSAPILVTGVSLSQTSLTFSAFNATQTLTATVTPSNAANKTLTWTSSNTSVATVSSNGVVTSKGYGTATITAKTTDGSNKSATCSVTVVIPKYTLKFVADGTVVSEKSVDYGSAITAPNAPAKTGYTFVSWGNVAATMPANDVTYTAQYSINQYTITFKVDGEVYKTLTQNYGTAITKPQAPTKEGYTFSGWQNVASTVPAQNLTYEASFTINKYTLKFVAVGTVVSEKSVDYGSSITAPNAPAKTGYTFVSWGNVAATMPANDVTYTAQYKVNKYKVTFNVDGKVYKTFTQNYGTAIVAPQTPTKEGYTFSCWKDIASTVPAHDVTYEAIFTINKYKLKFVADGTVVSEKSVDYGSAITAPNAPAKTGYTFVSWGNVPSTMPAKDVTYTAEYKVNQYKLIYMIDGVVYKTFTLDYDSIIIPEGDAEDDDYYYGWEEIPDRMPDHDVTVNAYITGIAAAGMGLSDHKYEIYTIDGKKLNNLQKGVNIIRLPNGKTQKIIIR
ncbi:MAG: InlB B-repeat-containing protein, partial [Bacteroidaceae bacterium]|nr:InlB B-repeat-containing protein [Bacteroidaceae bacterium]